MPRFTTLLMDADGTLMDFDKAEREALREALIGWGLVHDDAVLQRYHELNDALWKALERGEVTKPQLKRLRFEQLFAFLGAEEHPDPDEANDRFMELLSTRADLLPGVAETMPALAERYRILIITNGSAPIQQERWARTPIRAYVAGIYISDHLGVTKPSKAFFDAVFAAEPGLCPEDCLVVGDSLTSDIRGGINAGLVTCWVASPEQNAPADCRPDYRIESVAQLPELLSREALI